MYQVVYDLQITLNCALRRPLIVEGFHPVLGVKESLCTIFFGTPRTCCQIAPQNLFVGGFSLIHSQLLHPTIMLSQGQQLGVIRLRVRRRCCQLIHFSSSPSQHSLSLKTLDFFRVPIV